MRICCVPAGFDCGMNNLMWVIQTHCAPSMVTLVDPGYEAPILDYLETHSLAVGDILVTHHHYDHTDAVAAILQRFPKTKVYGPKNSPFPAITHPLEEGDLVSIGGSRSHFQVIATPGHTLDHICYYHADEGICFVGDNVFSAGTGKLFEGDAGMFLQSIKKIMHLPAHTRLYYGHDYALANLYFARKLEKENCHIDEHLRLARENHQHHRYNGSSSVATEHLINPFWRCHVAEIKNACEEYAGQPLHSPEEVFATLRQWR